MKSTPCIFQTYHPQRELRTPAPLLHHHTKKVEKINVTMLQCYNVTKSAESGYIKTMVS